MKFGKIIALLMAVVLGVMAFAACDEKEVDTEKPAVYYTVRFETNCDEKIEPKSVKEGTSLSEPVTLRRDGYVFEGWYNGSKHWDFSFSVKEDMTLTARWVEADSVFEHSPSSDGETTVVTGIKESKKEGVIYLPTYLGGFRVTTIGEGAFSKISSEQVNKIVVPEGITVVQNSAFAESSGIEIVVEGEISFVGEKAFLGCTGLSDIKLGGGIDTISAEAFEGSGLQVLKLPQSVKVIDENAFSECSALKIVILYDTTEVIRDMAFDRSAVESVLVYGEWDNVNILFENRVLGQNDEIAAADKYIYSEAKPQTAVPEGCKGYWYFNDKGEPKAWK